MSNNKFEQPRSKSIAGNNTPLIGPLHQPRNCCDTIRYHAWQRSVRRNTRSSKYYPENNIETRPTSVDDVCRLPECFRLGGTQRDLETLRQFNAPPHLI